ncbi:MAG TPA: SPFH domain-containing protein [Verrucomicrobiae bacterium]|jgi:regulator of protease activity HflC (stomatin/prohibitin superfamily)|nr:SPFH domain-containing protein [Verrucomicrobiae bacterium]
MERSIRKNGLINLLALFAITVAAFAVARVSDSVAGQVCSIFLGIGTLVAAVSWFQMRLEENERIEKLEFDELTRSKGASSLFETKDTEGFPAQRSREQFERFFVPAFTVLLLLAEAVGAFLLWRWFSKSPLLGELKQPTVGIALFALFALGLFLFGKFSATIARLENHRLLRPGASWLLLGAYLCFVVALGLVGVEAGYARMDYYVAEGLSALLGLVAIETLINLILEIYRPRVKGKVARPLYESRLVGLLGQPEGLIKTAGQALDYQFGFKVSETWFYRFFEKALAWIVLLQVAALFLSTTMVFIDPGEQALLEHFGRPATAVLGPGGHLKWPWPIDKVYRYRTEQIQSFIVGSQPDPALSNQDTILWTVAHAKEENFLVANRDERALSTNNVEGAVKSTPPVSLLTVSIPVQFQITNVLDWAYKNESATNLLDDLATREVVRYLVSADFMDIMSRERGAAADALRSRIQAAADERHLGAKIIFVGLQDIHPPQKVAGDYEKVVGANQTKLADILAAQADDIKTNALTTAAATNIIDVAEGDRTRTEVSAWAKAALFTNRIPAFAAAPSIYMEREYLQTFGRATANARKYILLTTNTHDVLQFDLQTKIREDLLEDVTITGKK